MRFLFLSDAGDSFGLAHRVQEEGNDVLFFARRTEAEAIGQGILIDSLSKVGRFEPEIVICDCTGFGLIADVFRSHGIPVLGGSLLADKLEMDRKFASEIMKQYKIKVPPSKNFNSFEEAEAFINEQEPNSRFVFKPSGSDSGNIPSFVSKDSESLIKMFEHYKKLVTGNVEFVLQEFIPGIDISTEVWFSKGQPIFPGNHTLETKHLMNDDLGPSGGCSGNVVWTTDSTVLTQQTIEKMFKFCKENEYTGCLDVNAIIAKEGQGSTNSKSGSIYALEFTPRFGYDATPTLLSTILSGELGAFLADGAKGQVREEGAYFQDGRYGGGLKLSISPWPFEDSINTGDIPTGLSAKKLVSPSFYPYNLKLNDQEEIVTSASYGMIGIAMASGATIEATMDDCVKQAEKIRVPDLQYRTDLGQVFKKRFGQIKRSLEL
jgi:phosphoribosylamine-glycine ligase